MLTCFDCILWSDFFIWLFFRPWTSLLERWSQGAIVKVWCVGDRSVVWCVGVGVLIFPTTVLELLMLQWESWRSVVCFRSDRWSWLFGEKLLFFIERFLFRFQGLGRWCLRDRRGQIHPSWSRTPGFLVRSRLHQWLISFYMEISSGYLFHLDASKLQETRPSNNSKVHLSRWTNVTHQFETKISPTSKTKSWLNNGHLRTTQTKHSNSCFHMDFPVPTLQTRDGLLIHMIPENPDFGKRSWGNHWRIGDWSLFSMVEYLGVSFRCFVGKNITRFVVYQGIDRKK